MAIKPTIYKFDIVLSDLNRDIYDNLQLTVALHPSETSERMMTRLLAFCLEFEETLSFTKGLSATDEPDIWSRHLNGTLEHWIDIGEPSPERIKKASHQAQRTSIYSFNSKSDTWWQQSEKDIAQLDIDVYQFNWADIQALATLLQRTMSLAITVSEDSLFISHEHDNIDIRRLTLQKRHHS